ncbi:MAG: TIGR03960 family B12-binding radical SAM protein [Candidatus Eisenbacteria bacterium]|nr:TIGR03960 family B12-binding radical SAM protein [Candidatus Eisenbacteria bacterium]
MRDSASEKNGVTGKRTESERARSDLSARIDGLLPLVSRPGRYLDSEINAFHPDWDPAPIKWLLVLPDVYEIGMSHQGLRILYDLLNRAPTSLAERAFAPWPDMEDRMRLAGIPFFSLESRRPARDFDVIGFSLPYELLATNVLNLLSLSNIPVRAEDRAEEDPLIAAGGPAVANPEPLADFVDFFLIGDGEEAVGELSRALASVRGRARKDRLRALAGIRGVYVPRFYLPGPAGARVPPERAHEGPLPLRPLEGAPFPVQRAYVTELRAEHYPRAPLIPAIEAVQDRLTLEIQRGCTQGCRFCQAGIFYRPMRERPVEDLIDLAASGLASSGWDEISLSSLSSADYSQILPLARALSERLRPLRAGLSLSSLRVDTFSIELAELVSRVRKTGLTFAPEAGTQRLRDAINKRVSEEDLTAVVSAAYERGWQRVKLYFMVGLPTETDEDLDGIARAVSQLRAIGRRHGPSRGVTVSVSPFVPKAHTPFQWEAFEGRDEIRRRIAYLSARAHSRWTPVKSHDPDLSFVEALLARGGRPMGRVIERVWKAGGRFEGWTEHFSIARWETALREEGIDPDAATGARDPGAPLPWDHIDLGVRRDWLLAERERGRRGETTEDCRSGACHACGLSGPGDRRLAHAIEPERWRALGERLTQALATLETPADEPRLRMRMRYEKRANTRFLSHLETGRLLTRLLRMARWPLGYTQGHNPHPRVAFAPPLPLGVEGRQELIDLYLTRAPSDPEWQALRELAPPGLLFLGMDAVPREKSSLSVEAAFARYCALLPAGLARRARAERRIEQFEEAGAVPFVKPGKARSRTVDLKRAVERIAWESCEEESAWQDGGPCGERRRARAEGERLGFTLRLQEASGHAIGPLPFLSELLKLSPEELARCLVTRLQFLDADQRGI